MESVLSGGNEPWPELRAKKNVQIVIDPSTTHKCECSYPVGLYYWHREAGIYLLVLSDSKQYLNMCCITYLTSSFDPDNPSCTNTN